MTLLPYRRFNTPAPFRTDRFGWIGESRIALGWETAPFRSETG